MINSKSKLAVITGAANGIGYALARKALAMNMQVIMLDYNEADLEKACSQLQQLGYEPIPYIVDVTNREAVFANAEQLIKEFGSPDLLINNAGSSGPLGAIWEINYQDFQRCLAVNLHSLMHMTQAWLPEMIKHQQPATIVTNSSLAGFYSAPLLAAYEIAKHGAVAFTEALYHDVQNRAPFIQVALLAPGFVRTEIIQRAAFNHHELTDAELSWLIQFGRYVRRGISPEEVAEKVFAALAKHEFYIFTDEELAYNVISQRCKQILSKANPSLFLFDTKQCSLGEA